ncbi:arginase family protein [Luteococcus peritonei]|uniref:Arginase family protein n=1 Tax=Luteococcus peritonei TaxID=88874 RepID=A0ABW4RZ75_9ACTN
MTESPTTLRLLWPQWQGATAANVVELFPEVPLPDARLAYAMGSRLLGHMLPPHDGPVAEVPVAPDDSGLVLERGIESRAVLLEQLRAALALVEQHDCDRVLTLGGECSVSLAPFSWLARRHGEDLAVVWLDSHPDVGTPDSEYHGHHAMAVSLLTGHGDQDFLAALPGTVDPSRVALAGLHSWTEDDIGHVADWGLTSFSPQDLRESSEPLLDWLASTGCSKVALHLDVDVVDANQVVLGLGAEPDGLSLEQARRVVDDVAGAAEMVGLTVAEYIPRQVIQMMGLLRGLPLA